MFIRALTAFLILPGVVAGFLPAMLSHLDPWRGKGFIITGGIVMGLGLFLLIWCVRDFYVAGKGTLAPWDPPKHLVIVGLYRFSRNPMYISVVTLICGWTLIAASPLLTAYMLLFAMIFHLRVIFYEEPCLQKLFGQQWTDYCAKVSRWISLKTRK